MFLKSESRTGAARGSLLTNCLFGEMFSCSAGRACQSAAKNFEFFLLQAWRHRMLKQERAETSSDILTRSGWFNWIMHFQVFLLVCVDT